MKPYSFSLRTAAIIFTAFPLSQSYVNQPLGNEIAQSNFLGGRVQTTSVQFDPLVDLTSATTGSNGSLVESPSITTTYDGQIIENLEINGRVTVQHRNVIIRNCRISNEEYYGIFAPDDDGHDVSGLTVEYNTISGPINGIAGKGNFYRNNIFNVDNGVNVWGPSIISENYIHNLGSVMSNSFGHNDGIENNGSPMALIRNRIEASLERDTSAVMSNNEFGPLVDILIEGNYLSGGQYTIYIDDTKHPENRVSNFLIRKNVIEKGRYGHSTLYGSNVLIDSSNILK